MLDDDKIIIFPGPRRSIAAKEYDEIRAEYMAALKESISPVAGTLPKIGFFARFFQNEFQPQDHQQRIQNSGINFLYLLLGSALVIGLWVEYMYPFLEALNIEYVDSKILPSINACFLVGSYLSMVYSLYIVSQQKRLIRLMNSCRFNKELSQ